ncbi:hypothetical protein LTS18_000122, partial [Coniosporium uncinatum]
MLSQEPYDEAMARMRFRVNGALDHFLDDTTDEPNLLQQVQQEDLAQLAMPGTKTSVDQGFPGNLDVSLPAPGDSSTFSGGRSIPSNTGMGFEPLQQGYLTAPATPQIQFGQGQGHSSGPPSMGGICPGGGMSLGEPVMPYAGVCLQPARKPHASVDLALQASSAMLPPPRPATLNHSMSPKLYTTPRRNSTMSQQSFQIQRYKSSFATAPPTPVSLSPPEQNNEQTSQAQKLQALIRTKTWAPFYQHSHILEPELRLRMPPPPHHGILPDY